VTHLNYRMLGLVVLLLCVLTAVLALAFYGPNTTTKAVEDVPPLPPATSEGDVLLGMPRTYGDIPPKEPPMAPPKAIPLPPVTTIPPMTASLQPLVPPSAPAPPVQPIVFPPPQPPAQPPLVAQAAVPKPEPKEKKPWVLTPTVLNLDEPSKTKAARSPEEQKADETQSLIHPANWARPLKPLQTLYRSQVLVGETTQAIDSSIPGTVRVRLTEDVWDKFGYHRVILPAGSLVIAEQQGSPQFGARRLEMALQQIELPTSEVIALKASLGDQDGANGLTGKVNNHYGKLIGATLINAVLNIGIRSAAGTPAAGVYFQNPAQAAAQDVAQSTAGDINRLAAQQLKVPPTIEIPAHTPVTISLAENIQFNRPPILAK
jgi:type IV secretion system protein VirB10